jgi:hypothetical protein
LECVEGIGRERVKGRQRDKSFEMHLTLSWGMSGIWKGYFAHLEKEDKDRLRDRKSVESRSCKRRPREVFKL